MSTKSSFQRNSINGLFPSLLNPDSHQSSSSGTLSSNMTFSPDYASASQQRLAPETNSLFRHQQRPISEILDHESSISPETEALDKWFEDLQQYESSLESMATASLDPKYKEEVQHVDQWFRYLNEAERTATIYTLLQHSTQVQIRFFIAVLQQMSNKDPLGALLSPAHPEKVDMQAKLAGAMKKAELEASQKLLSVLPYQTGQVISRPNSNNIGRRNHIDRHSFALGDTNEYDRLFKRMPATDFLNPNNGLLDDGMLPQPLARNQHQQRGMFDHSAGSRPKSVIEGDLSSIFSGDWSYGGTAGGLASHQKIHQKQAGSVGSNRPKSADISNWSFGITSSASSSKNIREKDSLASPWSGLSPTVSTFNEQPQQQQQAERPQSVSDVDQQLSMIANNWSLNNNNNSSSRPVSLSEDSKSFRRRAVNRTSIPGTVPETDEHLIKNGIQSPPPPAPLALPNQANIVLSMYEESSTPSAALIGASETKNPYYLIQPLNRPTTASGPSSPVPSQPNPNSVFGNRTTITNKSQQPKQQQQNYGQFLNPNDRVLESETGYLSDHSDASNRSTGSRAMKKKNYNSGYFNNNNARGGGNVNNNSSFGTGTNNKDKKNLEVVDIKLLEDVPAWLRSLRLHKYNPIFETMKWQDMLKLDDEALIGKGVAALGARRKLLKVFDQVKAHCETNKIAY